MSRGAAAELVRTAKRCSFKRITVFACCFNLIIALLVLRSMYVSYVQRISSGRIAETQRKRVLESIQLRKALEFADLVEVVGKLKKEVFDQAKMAAELPESLKQELAIEILERLKNVNDTDNALEQQAVELWRVNKLEELEKIISTKSGPNSSTSYAEVEMLKQALESNWPKVMEDIGFWMPSNISNTKHNDKLENEQDEEDIIPGRPLPPECHAEPHTDYDGAAVRWGLTHHTESAADCCQACLDQAKQAKPGQMRCNIWVYCPSEFGCFSPDIYEHKHQECWLKQAEKPRLNFKDRYSESYRSDHPTAPIIVPWMSGVVSG